MFGLNKITLYILSGVIACIVLTSAYYIWKRDIEYRAMLEYNQAQLEQSNRDQQAFIQRQQELADQQRQIAITLADQTRRLRQQFDGIRQTIDSTPDSPAPIIIQQTIQQLREAVQR